MMVHPTSPVEPAIAVTRPGIFAIGRLPSLWSDGT
jgi:hypothetical protein